MRPIAGFEKVQAYSGGSDRLPAGGYIARIEGAKVVGYNGRNGYYEKLEIAVDIMEGDYAFYFKEVYQNSTQENKKWKGVLRLYVPTGDGSDNDNRTQRVLKGVTNALEDSNAGYHWDWDETKLKGLKCGILVRDKEYDYEGRHGFYSEVFAIVSTDTVRENKFKTPEPKYLNGSAPATPTYSADDFKTVAPGEDDYPFA